MIYQKNGEEMLFSFVNFHRQCECSSKWEYNFIDIAEFDKVLATSAFDQAQNVNNFHGEIESEEKYEDERAHERKADQRKDLNKNQKIPKEKLLEAQEKGSEKEKKRSDRRLTNRMVQKLKQAIKQGIEGGNLETQQIAKAFGITVKKVREYTKQFNTEDQLSELQSLVTRMAQRQIQISQDTEKSFQDLKQTYQTSFQDITRQNHALTLSLSDRESKSYRDEANKWRRQAHYLHAQVAELRGANLELEGELQRSDAAITYYRRQISDLNNEVETLQCMIVPIYPYETHYYYNTPTSRPILKKVRK